jgi:hypothetical protein
MAPFMPDGAEDLKDLALEVIQKSAVLGGRLHALTLQSLHEMLMVSGLARNVDYR